MFITIITILLGIVFLGLGAFSTFNNYLITIGNLQFSAAILFTLVGAILVLTCLIRRDSLDRIVTLRTVGSWRVLIIIVFVLILGVFAGFFVNSIVATRIAAPQPYDIFKEVLYTTLTIITLLITVLGLLVYQTVRYRLLEETSLEAEEISSYLFAHIYTPISYLHWFNWRSTEDSRNLDSAIEFAQKAFERYERFIDEYDPKSILLVCFIRNNWGYFLAERGREEDRELALSSAEYLRENLYRFPERAVTWRDTINFIESRYPPSQR
jgi:hypothetical protein